MSNDKKTVIKFDFENLPTFIVVLLSKNFKQSIYSFNSLYFLSQDFFSCPYFILEYVM